MVIKINVTPKALFSFIIWSQISTKCTTALFGESMMSLCAVGTQSFYQILQSFCYGTLTVFTPKSPETQTVYNIHSEQNGKLNREKSHWVIRKSDGVSIKLAPFQTLRELFLFTYQLQCPAKCFQQRLRAFWFQQTKLWPSSFCSLWHAHPHVRSHFTQHTRKDA